MADGRVAAAPTGGGSRTLTLTRVTGDAGGLTLKPVAEIVAGRVAEAASSLTGITVRFSAFDTYCDVDTA